jgi:hypothetical protein
MMGIGEFFENRTGEFIQVLREMFHIAKVLAVIGLTLFGIYATLPVNMQTTLIEIFQKVIQNSQHYYVMACVFMLKFLIAFFLWVILSGLFLSSAGDPLHNLRDSNKVLHRIYVGLIIVPLGCVAYAIVQESKSVDAMVSTIMHFTLGVG